jgi:diguanylate cyclase (GGDEF)-like protein
MPAGKSATPLCEQFGFDDGWREAQLRLIGLEEYPRDLIRQLHQQVLLRDVAVSMVDAFYTQLLRNSQAAALLSSFDIGHLKERQIDYLSGFGVDYRGAAYFESRARIGVAHARVGVPLSLYLSSFGVLQTLMLEAIANQVPDGRDWLQLNRLVLRLMTLDIALATEVYHRAQIKDLGRSVKHLEQQQKALRSQLNQDALTGVSSRTSLLRALEEAIARAAKTGQPLCVIMADLDHFKTVNDTHGHLTGDKVLKEVAARIKAALREFDVVGRYGGEEFVLLLENTTNHTALQIAERVRTRIGSEPIHISGKRLDLTISQGLAERQDGDDCQSLLARADKAMYKAKQDGRDRVAEV